MDPIADQMLATIEEASGYSEMTSAFHTPRLRVASLVSGPREMPDLARYAEQLPDSLDAVARALQVRASAESPAPYLVWARYPNLNWPILRADDPGGRAPTRRPMCGPLRVVRPDWW